MAVAGVDRSEDQASVAAGIRHRSLAAGILNLLVPGVGIIWFGRIGVGVACGLVFAACANSAIWAVLLIPDDLPAWAPPAAMGLAAAAYLGCQVQFVRSARQRRSGVQAAIRRAALAAVSEALERGDHAAGLAALAPISYLGTADLLVAYRLAQLLTAAGDRPAALAAWRRVRELDRHHIYQDEWRTATRRALDSTELGRELAPDGSRL